MVRILIFDVPGMHADGIKFSISGGYGSDISDQIGVSNNAFVDAQNNEDIIAVARCYTDITTNILNAQNAYPRVQTFYPLGSNVFYRLYNFAHQEPPVIITCGAGDIGYEDENNTGFGFGLEFWDVDNNPNVGPDESSYAMRVLGKILKIKDTLNCTWWEARFRARMTADRNEPNRETYMWDLHNGYGFINVAAAIAYKGIIPVDPYNPGAEITIANEEIQFTKTPTIGLSGEPVTVTIPAQTIYAENVTIANQYASAKAENLANQQANFSAIPIIGIESLVDTDYGTGNFIALSKIILENSKTECKLQVFVNQSSISKLPVKTLSQEITLPITVINSIYSLLKEIRFPNGTLKYNED